MDTKEYERLVTKYLDCIYRVALNSCRNSMDAEDIVQNAFLYYVIKELPTQYRQILHLYYFEDYSVREIADIILKEINMCYRKAGV